MTPFRSLRARLVALMLVMVASVWLTTTYLTWREAVHEIEELLAHPPTTDAAHLAKERDEVAHEIAEHLVRPVVVALPVLAVLLVIAIGIALRPLKQLTRDIESRAPGRLDPLSLDTLPTEAIPLVTRLNALFADILRAQEKERHFTADAAHELRTPLAALKAQAQVAQGATQDTERQHALARIIEGCDRASHLVAQLLTLARLDALRPTSQQTISLRAIAEEVLAQRAGFAIDHGCDLTLADGDAQIRGDATLLGVLLRNLVDNAILHSGCKQIEVAIASDARRATLSVRDDGRGIPPDEAQKVLQRFYRLNEENQAAGSGLGLSIVQRIAELHGATLRIEQGAGSKGTIVLLGFS